MGNIKNYEKVSETDNKRPTTISNVATYRHRSGHPEIKISKVNDTYKIMILAHPPEYRSETLVSRSDRPTTFKTARKIALDFMRNHPDGGRWADKMKNRRY